MASISIGKNQPRVQVLQKMNVADDDSFLCLWRTCWKTQSLNFFPEDGAVKKIEQPRCLNCTVSRIKCWSANQFLGCIGTDTGQNDFGLPPISALSSPQSERERREKMANWTHNLSEKAFFLRQQNAWSKYFALTVPVLLLLFCFCCFVLFVFCMAFVLSIQLPMYFWETWVLRLVLLSSALLLSSCPSRPDENLRSSRCTANHRRAVKG